MSDAVLAAQNIQQSYGDGQRRIQVLHDINMTVSAGEFAALVGRSGSGKTSLLQILGLLAAPAAGEVILDGASVATASGSELARLRRDMLGFVFQSGNLLPQHDALTNVALPWAGASAPGRKRAMELLDRFGIADRAHHRPDQLSGGEQQRVALARALINRPRIILADEPTGSLDADNEATLLASLRELVKQGTAALVITHNPTVASAADTTWELVAGRVRRSVPDTTDASREERS